MEAEADSTGLGTGLVFQASLSAWYFRPIHQADSEASSEADSQASLEADSDERPIASKKNNFILFKTLKE